MLEKLKVEEERWKYLEKDHDGRDKIILSFLYFTYIDNFKSGEKI